ncbi:MAG TPA: vWA domain-containing protein [Pirellulales bacterium]|jgi:hypothetical protein|nr:vWA domain-containing protein [Pirellulales bacterium]
MSYSNSRSFRRKRKGQDPLAMLLAVVSVVGLPVLGFAAYKLLNRPPTVIVTTEHITAPPIKYEKFHPDPPKKDAQAMASASRGNDSFGPGLGSGGSADGRVTSIPDAVNRITEQLSKAITDTKSHQVLVVWLFDASASNDHARGEVLGRLDALYQELAAAAKKTDEDKAPAVLSVVGAFGPSVEFLTKEPTADTAAVKHAADGIKSNTSHIENTFAAVQAAMEKYSSYRLKGRYVSLVIVSDEAADDEQKIDQVLPTLKRYKIPVYCIGVQASFGSIAGSNQMSEGRGADTKEIRVRQGPESRFPEWIHLQYPDGRDANVVVDTELGPYSLARLCQETDGEYFALPQIGGGFGMNDGGFGWNEPKRGKRRPAAMMTSPNALPRKYAPVYFPEQEIQAQLETNKAKKALVEAAKLPSAEVLANPTTMFTNADDVERTRALDKAQKPAARIQPGIDAYYNALKPGEPDEAKLAGEPRWQAGFDLAYGRAMAAKARADGYMSQLAVMKGGPKRKDPKPVQLLLEQTNDPSGNSVVDKLASKARDLLNRVINEHPGTPWALSAEHELQQPMGWKWIEQ